MPSRTASCSGTATPEFTVSFDANSICERFVGICRREVLDHLLIFSARYLDAVIKEFLVHYHQARPHQGLDQRCPAPAEPNVVPLQCMAKSFATTAWEGYCTSTPGPRDRVGGASVTAHPR